jgi:conjugal transfer pilus assembly protein TraF
MKNAITLLVSVSSIATAIAQADKPVRIDDAYGDAFINYAPYVAPQKRSEPKPKPAVTATPSNEAKQQPKGEQKVDFKWLSNNIELLKQRAIDNPTEANVSAYLYAQRIIMDKAQRFQEMNTRVVNEDPLLNENNRVPYASAGAQSIRNADYLAQQKAVRELAEIGGLVAFVDGSCRFCAMQVPILAMLKANFGMETLVVSIDGKNPKGYTGPVVVDNGLYRKLDLKLTPSLVYVPKPKGYEGVADPNKYLIVSQGFYAADELTKLIAFAGHNMKLLSAETTRDLDVWTRGVASTEDLQSLTLDIDKPETFKTKLQPILLKQYQ